MEQEGTAAMEARTVGTEARTEGATADTEGGMEDMEDMVECPGTGATEAMEECPMVLAEWVRE